MKLERHSPFLIFLHWSTVVTVMAAFSIGIFRGTLPKGEMKTTILTIHMSLGFLVLLLTVMRLALKSTNTVLPAADVSRTGQLVSRVFHIALYVGLIAIPLIGIWSAWAKGRNIAIFGLLPIPSQIATDQALAKILESSHEIAAYTLLAAAGLHAMAAIFHHVVLKDSTLKRMMPLLNKI
jgi:cytochrome b561